MSTFIVSLFVFATFYFPLRLLKENWVKLSLPSWWTIPAGILSWGVVVSLAGPPIAIGYVCAGVVKSLSIGAAFEAAAVFFLSGIAANLVVVHREILDWDRMKPFIRTSLMFANYFAEQEDLFVQLEKKQIRDIHRENSGLELIESRPHKKDLPHTDPEAAKRMLDEARRRPLQSAHLPDEFRQLEAGETVDLTDTLTINTLKHPTLDLYRDCHEMRINAASGLLSFAVHFVRIAAEMAVSPDLIFHVKQDLYDLLQALINEEWLKPYTKFFEKISVTCFRVRLDGFDLPQQHPFMKIDIPVSELRLREGKFYSVADLHSIATITMVD